MVSEGFWKKDKVAGKICLRKYFKYLFKDKEKLLLNLNSQSILLSRLEKYISRWIFD